MIWGGLQVDAPTETNEAHAIAQDRAGRKLLTVRRRLLVDIKSLNNALKTCRSYDKFSEQISKCVDLRLAYSKYREALNDITDSDWFRELSDKIGDKYDQCMERFDALESEYMVVSSKPKIPESHDKLNDSENNDNECNIEPSDSASQVSGGVTNLDKASNRSAVRQIEIDKRRADLKITHELQKEKILVKARAEEAEALALAKLRLEEAALDAEEKLLACSERGLSVTSLRSSKSRRSKTEINITAKPKTTDLKTINLHDSSVAKPRQLDGSYVQMVENKPLHRASFTWQGCDLAGERPVTTKFGEKRCKTAFNPTAKEFVYSSAQAKAETNDRALLTESRNDILPATSTLYVPPDVPAKPLVCESTMQTYLDRQGRNEYVNLASQIAYDGTNMAFVFYENQILRLMDESPYPERRFEVLRASCVGQPREMVNLFFAPMKAMTTSQRIEKALARLKERYGVPAGLTSEPKVREIRHGPSIFFNTASLKSFNEELNLLEVYAYAHNELEKLSGQLTLDTANRLPNFLKRRFLDYLTKIGSDLNRPGFDSLRGFVAHELSVSTSDYAQTFFGSDEKGKSRDAGSGGRKNNQVRVRRMVLSEEGQRSSLISSGTERPMESSHNQMKLPPFCFVCDNNKSRHFLADCDKFKSFTPHQKRKTVVEAYRCLNCLSRGHTARECKQPSKCRQCGPSCSRKHTTALHDWFELPASAGAGGACGGRQGSASGAPSPSRDGKHTDDDAQKVKVLKISDQGDTSKSVVLLRTSAVRVINPATGRSTLAYAQHDTASQATLISEGLRNELDLETVKDPSVTIKTLSDHTAITEGRTDFSLESLYTGEEFSVKNALVVPNFTDDESVLPHSVDVAGLDNFNDVEIPTIPERKCIDVLIGQADKGLLTVLHESENVDPNKPNYVLTKLGPIASGGRVSAATNAYTSLKINLNANCGCIDEDCCVKLKREIANLKQSLRESNLENEALQPSRNDERAEEIVESDIKVVDNRYEIPVPLNMAVVEQLPNNYQSALDRAVSVRRSALKNSDLKETLTDTFGELIDEKWIVPVEENSSSGPTWYLPFFVTKQEKARVVDLWLHGPAFLQGERVEPRPSDQSVTVRAVTLNEKQLVNHELRGLDQLVESCPDLYTLKKRTAYLTAFKEYFIAVKVKKKEFVRPVLNASYLYKAFVRLLRYVQNECFGSAVEFLKENSPDEFDTLLRKLSAITNNVIEMHFLNELKTLRKLRPCVGPDLILRVKGRLDNASLPVDTKHPIILPGRHALTRLIVLNEHADAGHAGPSYTLMLTRQRFWIIHGISGVKRYLTACGRCALDKAKPVRQLMSDLPSFRVTALNKPFKFCGTDYFGPFFYKQNRNLCKAWGILFTCLCTRCVHVEIVTSMDLNSFILAFTRFTNLRGPVDTFFSDNGKTFCAAEKQLPLIIDSTEFHNSLRQRNINWVRIPAYAPSQAGSWESIIVKNALHQVLGEARRKPSLIELQTFASDAVRIVNDRPLTTLSDKPNDLKPLTPSCFLGQHLAPNTPVSTFHDKGDLRKDYLYNASLAQKFWSCWMKSYLPTFQGRAKWRTLRNNLTVGQLVLVGDAEDLSKRGAYRLGRVHCLHPQVRKGRDIVRRATVAVLAGNPDSGKTEIKYILRDLSKIAPV